VGSGGSVRVRRASEMSQAERTAYSRWRAVGGRHRDVVVVGADDRGAAALPRVALFRGSGSAERVVRRVAAVAHDGDAKKARRVLRGDVCGGVVRVP
jgi:hypothetical protein